MGKRKDRWTAVLEGRYFSALLRLVAEHDLAGGAVHGLDDSEALQLDALAADEVAALLEALLNGDADALDSGISSSRPSRAQPLARKSSMMRTWSSGVRNFLETMTL